MRIRWMIGGRLWAGSNGAHEWRTADPSASPDFLSGVFGFGRLRVVLFEENHIRCRQ
jgi:hypothetical protein